MVTQQLSGTAPQEMRSGITVHRFPDRAARDGKSFTAHAADAGVFAGAGVVCLFGVGHDPTADWWQPILDTTLALGGVRLLKIGTEGDISIRGIPPDLYQRLDGVLCQTPGIAAEARAIGITATDCHPVRNGLNVAEWTRGLPSRADARRVLRVPDDAFVVAAIGRFTHRKRFGDLIRAYVEFARRVAKVPAPVLLLHGSDFGQDDGEEAALRTLTADLPTWADVRFLAPSPDVRATLAACDVAASLAVREGAPNVFIETFAAARPMIATDLPGHRVYVRDGVHGLLVPVGISDETIAATTFALTTLYGDPSRCASMGVAARRRADNFDIARTVQDYLCAFSNARSRMEGTGR